MAHTSTAGHLEFKKRHLGETVKGYAVTTMPLLGETRVVAASEGTGPAVAFVGPDMSPCTISDGPGGCMGLCAVPGHDDCFFMISRFYPRFRGDAAGVELFRMRDGFQIPWDGERILDLAMLHRITTASTDAGHYLFLASISGAKAYEDDWSQPGAVYACRIPNDLSVPWAKEVILPNIHRNHGMTTASINGVDSLVVSGSEGVIAIALPNEGVTAWNSLSLVAHEVSEVQFLDIDGDGIEEMATIEPFHGNQICVYKQFGGKWLRIFDDTVGFAHGLSVGMLNGTPCIASGDRAGTRDLVCYYPDFGGSGGLKKAIIDRGTGSLGTKFARTAFGDAIVTSNADPSEYALYTLA